MLDKVLIANRGEIARRILRTCHHLGIGTVAIHSDLDADEPHVREAGAAVAVGPAPPSQSYLAVERVVDAALDQGCDAVHPGYGFLAENADFAEAVRAAGLVFVGPSPDVLRLMGDKAAAKRHLAAAGVPVIPGEHAADLDDAGLVAAGKELGTPLVVKAVAGGGGKGMRTVHDLATLADAITAARREAAGAFGDDRLILERLVTRPRHVEVQVVGDRYGTVVHLGERECSVQRRHQKLVEETPSPAVDDALRSRMTRAAVAAAAAVDYEGAGTIEFLVAGDTLDHDEPEFAFLEVNTRLQVEHPVTEFVTGLDLVELQLRIAAGEPLGIGQDDIVLRGHAIEVRLCAEDPVTHLPKTGQVLRVGSVTGPAARIDSGIEAGSTVTTHYDSLLAKLIAYGPDRERARERLRSLLDATVVHGVETNHDLLAAVLDEPAFGAGDLTTAFLDEHLPDFVPPPTPEIAWLAAAVVLGSEVADGSGGPWDRLGPRRPSGAGGWPVHLDDGSDDRLFRVTASGDGHLVGADGRVQRVRAGALDSNGTMRIDVDGEGHTVVATPERGPDGLLAVWVHAAGVSRRLAVLAAARHSDAAALAGGAAFSSPMPGTVLAVEVAPGDEVPAGYTLVVVEAMKMEHPVVAPTDGVVTAVHVNVGDAVDAGSALVAFQAEGHTRDGGTSVEGPGEPQASLPEDG